MRLRKYHGLGNDYLVLEEPAATELGPSLIRALCDRHTGPGADGLLLPLPANGVRIYNPDGSEAERSGNGLRIFARWLVDHCGAPIAFEIRTITGDIAAVVAGSQITLAMPPAIVEGPLDPGDLDLSDEIAEAWLVNVGNPHCVLIPSTDTPLDELPWREWGAQIEAHPAFENRTNVQVCRTLSAGLVEARIWERGAGETLASGTSACAVAAATQARGDHPAGDVIVRMPGGELVVSVTPNKALTLTGPAEEIGSFDVASHWLVRRLT